MIIETKNISSESFERPIPDFSNVGVKINKKTIDIIQLEKELSEVTGLTVNVNFDNSNKSGSIKLECKSLSEFNYIIEKIKS